MTTPARLLSALLAAALAVAGLTAAASPAAAAEPSIVPGSRAAIVAGAAYVVEREVGYGRTTGYGHSSRKAGPTKVAGVGEDVRISWRDGFLDCSGLVRYAYSRAGIDLGVGGTNSQVPQFYPIDDAAALPGDVVFFGEVWDGRTAAQKDFRDPDTGVWWNVTHVSITDGTGRDYEAIAPGSVAAYGNVSTRDGWFIGYFRLKAERGTLDGAVTTSGTVGTAVATETGGTVECGSANPDRGASSQYCHGVREWVVDVNGDDRADIIDLAGVTAAKAADGGARGWRVSRGASSMGRWTAALDSAPGIGTLAYGDFDGDGLTDVIDFTGRTRAEADGGEDFGWIVAYGTATGELTPWTRVRATPMTPADLDFTFGDFDGDGATDVLWFTGVAAAAAEPGQRSGWVISYGGPRGTMTGWRAALASTATPGSQQLATGDFDGDGRTDVIQFTGRAQADAKAGQVYGWVVSYGRESRAMTWQATVLGSTVTPATTDLELGDFDGDGSTDVLAFTGTGWDLSRGGARGDMTPAATVRAYAATPASSSLTLGDFDGDGRTDVLWFTGRSKPQAAAGEPYGWSIAYGRGDGTMTRWRPATNRGITPRSRELAIGDVDGDGSTDILHFTGVTRRSADGGAYGWEASWGGTRGHLTAWTTVRNTAITPSRWLLSVTPL
ncbi:FG-GAP-like repeat-containing protein [Demequina sp. SYSU T00192]|uniref:FG-GAP-like repeat-containing protein n=1 Tax=Demequina litoralis TaxID=3051660 RepID=A0ABT8GC90_9MICO|nr:FG-GAP-like repeat-containing protein [Demequina sp. SYSU T00192]MDN4476284.1 FG-GAP-like repeat-containing protein [Demequina sp. SYSU T00192]